MENISYPTKIWIGAQSQQRFSEFNNERLLVVTDQAMTLLPGFQVLLQQINSSNTIHIFSEVVPDPPIEVIVAGVSVMEKLMPTVILAVGGGSAIDAAKGIKYFGQKAGLAEEILFVAVPTTSGAGSEVTNFSVITDSQKGQKYPLVTPDIQPDEAILATDLLLSIPPKVTADTGMDVLTHAIEAYVSTKANDFSDALCEKVVRLVFDYLPACFEDGENPEAREKMHHASCMAGMAFNTTSLGLNHGLAHSLGGRFHVAHGRLNAVLLTQVILYNSGSGQYAGPSSDNQWAAERYSRLATLLTGEHYAPRNGVKALVRLIDRLNRRLGIPKGLSACGIDKQALREQQQQIIQGALQDGCTSTNPRKPVAADLNQILAAAVQNMNC